MLCPACSSLFQTIRHHNRSGWHPFQNDFQAHAKAARSGCYICSETFRDIQIPKRHPWYKDDYLQWPALGISHLLASWVEDADNHVWKLTVHASVSRRERLWDRDLPDWSYSLVPASTDKASFGFNIRSLTSGHCEAVHRLYNEIPSTTGSPAVGELARSWYTECRQKHQHCNQTLPPLARPVSDSPRLAISVKHGMRLLDVRHYPARLIDKNDIPKDPEYAVLSHCWGKEPFLTLTGLNRSEWLLGGIPELCLPENLRNALMFCRWLQIPYMWIDSLCIVQSHEGLFTHFDLHKPPQEVKGLDWGAHVDMMGDIYMRSAVCIATAAATKASEPSFRDREPNLIKPVAVSLRRVGHGSSTTESEPHLLIGMNHALHGHRHAAIASRGWVLQERLLSPRVLTLGHNQVFWECRETEAQNICETFPSGLSAPCLRNGPFSLPLPENGFGTDFERAMKAWQDTIEMYSACQLTYPEKDKFAAFDGVTRYFARLITGDTDVLAEPQGGFFNMEFPGCLLWHIPSEVRPRMRNKKYQAPSWSWLAANVPVKTYRYLCEDGFYSSIVHITSGVHDLNSWSVDGQKWITMDACLVSLKRTDDSRYTLGDCNYSGTQVEVHLDAQDNADIAPNTTRFLPILIVDEKADNRKWVRGLIVCPSVPVELDTESREWQESYEIDGGRCLARLGTASFDNSDGKLSEVIRRAPLVKNIMVW